MSSDACPKYRQFPPAVQVPERAKVQRHPGETSEQAVDRYMRERFPGVNVRYFPWPDHEIEVVAPERFTFKLEVV